jgi:hypothetical protein
MIKVHVLQVSARLPEQMDLFRRSVGAGHTIRNWQSLKDAQTGNIAVWYVAGDQVYAAWGWVSGPSVRVAPGEEFGPYKGPVAGTQWLTDQVSRGAVKDACGVDSGLRPGPQTVPDDKAIASWSRWGSLPSNGSRSIRAR